MKRSLKYALVVLAVFCAAPDLVRAGDGNLTLTTAAQEPLVSGDGTGFFQLIVTEMFRRIGRRAEVVVVPAERAIKNANQGIIDGNIPRIKGMEKLYPDIRMVPEPFMTYDFMAFSDGRSFAIDGWRSIEPFDVGIVTGWKILEKNAKGARSVTEVTLLDQLFGLLKRKRAQVVLAERWMGLHQIREMGLEAAKVLEPPLASREMYIYLHKRHESLLDPLAEALRTMKTDGTYRRIRERVFGDLIARP